MDTREVLMSVGLGHVGYRGVKLSQGIHSPLSVGMCYPRGRIDHECSGTCTLHLRFLSSGWSAYTVYISNFVTTYIVASHTSHM